MDNQYTLLHQNQTNRFYVTLEQRFINAHPTRNDVLELSVDISSALFFLNQELDDDRLEKMWSDMKWDIKFNKPVVISEFGGGALQGLHGTTKERWTEEYQEYLY